MLKLNKKYLVTAALFLLGLVFLLFDFRFVSAAAPKVYQVKLANSPVVYFLNYASHHKKAYLNATSYFSYGHRWLDVKIISTKDLAAWPNFKLIKTESAPTIYYVNGNKRTKLNNRDDLERFGFLGEPILNVNEIDLNEYNLVSYKEIGLLNNSSTSGLVDKTNSSNNSLDQNPSVETVNVTPNSTTDLSSVATSLGKLIVYSDPVVISGNNLVSGTLNNLMGVFRFKATGNSATLKAVTFHFGGVYGNDLLKQAYVRDENNNDYATNNNLRTNDRELIVTFKEPLTISSGEEKTLKIYLDFNSGDYNNQTTQLNISQSVDIASNLTPTLVSASGGSSGWPLTGTLFKLISATNLIGSLSINKESLVGVSNANSGLLLGKFNLSETSGNEDAIIKKIVFQNAGSAHNNDLVNFSLSNNGQVIARTAGFDSDGTLTFNINYLRVSKASYTTLTINGNLIANYNKAASVDFQTLNLTSAGQTYNFTLPIKITNLNESFLLN